VWANAQRMISLRQLHALVHVHVVPASLHRCLASRRMLVCKHVLHLIRCACSQRVLKREAEKRMLFMDHAIAQKRPKRIACK